jgi:hypothetical protein
MFLLFFAADQTTVYEDSGRPAAVVSFSETDKSCEQLSPAGLRRAPGWVDGDWVMLSETPGGLVLCNDGQLAHIAWRAPPSRQAKKEVAVLLGAPEAASTPRAPRERAPSSNSRTEDSYVQFQFVAQGGRWDHGPYDGGAGLEAHVSAGKGNWLTGTVSAHLAGTRPLGAGGSAEFLVGPGNWVTSWMELSLVGGPSIEGNYGLLPVALQFPVEARAVVDLGDWIRLDTHARGTSNLALDPLRRGHPLQDYSVGLDLWMGDRDLKPMLVLGSEVRWHLESRRVMFTVGLGARD